MTTNLCFVTLEFSLIAEFRLITSWTNNNPSLLELFGEHRAKLYILDKILKLVPVVSKKYHFEDNYRKHNGIGPCGIDFLHCWSLMHLKSLFYPSF